jgi:hypothetical protein
MDNVMSDTIRTCVGHPYLLYFNAWANRHRLVAPWATAPVSNLSSPREICTIPLFSIIRFATFLSNSKVLEVKTHRNEYLVANSKTW